MKQFSDSFGGKVGKVGWIPEVDLDQKIVNEVKKLEIKKSSQPLKGENGYFIIKVLDKKIIGEEIIDDVSLYKFELIEKKEEINLLLNKIKNCDELAEFSSKYATTNSGSLGTLKYNELPKEACNYLDRISELTQTPIDIISTGPERNETIVLKNPFT